ncbi:MAG: PRC-barrel domain-containing protein [Microlunatus sp.]|nr:PRC-barrel domain-containing protein [Microlunatus sp.]MDN5770756.1 PRC-barrel domain-containing protein [Microlunatus sp.]MDN5804388.1 PRC-barrel domain-containing protein [Microlunatus sp.]
MTRLLRTSEITGRPVVTLAGEDVAQIKDVVYAPGRGRVGAFTLAGRGLFAGPLPVALAWSSVVALGNDAVMIADEEVLAPLEQGVDQPATSGRQGNVLGARVLTDTGTDLGLVADVIVQVSEDDSACEVVGYEIESSDAAGSQADTLLIPLPETLSASGEHLIVPGSVTKFVRHDLAGFGAAIEGFRSHLGGED